MAQAGKYGFIHPDNALPDIGQDEPVFILRAHDSLSVLTLESYASLADGAGCTEEHVEGVGDAIQRFRVWQATNGVKVPGT
jgi:hypothetical protein